MKDETIDNFETYLEKKIGVIPFHYEPCEISEEKFFEAISTHNDNGVVIKEICHGVRVLIKTGEFGFSYQIIFEGKSFSIEDVDLITELFDYVRNEQDTNKRIFKVIYFIDCEFRTPFFITHKNGRLSFFNCVFLRDFTVSGMGFASLGFYHCKFNEKLDLTGIRTGHRVDIQNCFFDENSSLILKNVFFHAGGRFYFKNSQILGSFDAENAKLCRVLFENISFFNKFNFNKATFWSECEFKNIAFPNPRGKESMRMQAIFAKVLEKSGLHQVVSELGLSTSISSNNSSDDEEKEYQDALQKGWLNPKQAARFLGKSVRTLQEKRKNDQMKITKESLPFIGEGKDILYPLDALKAYLEQDWNLLKELRKKYWKKD